MSRFLAPLLLCFLVGCWRVDPLYCETHADCADNAGLTFCDVDGEYEASEHIGRTCIPQPEEIGTPAIEVKLPNSRTFLRIGNSTSVHVQVISEVSTDVRVSVEGAPDGVTFDELVLPAGTSSGTLTIRASETARIADTTIVVQAKAGTGFAKGNLPVEIIGKAGSVDTTFGDGGTALTDAIPGGADEPRKALAQGEKVIVSMKGSTLVRLKADGTLDTDFGVDGRAILDGATVGLHRIGVSDFILDEQHRIVVVGTGQVATTDGSPSTIWIARLTPDGRPDEALPGRRIFGNDEVRHASSVAASTGGQILIMGATGVDSLPTIWRVYSDGILDADFGLRAPSEWKRGLSPCLLPQPDGSILVKHNDSLARVSVNGDQDLTFGSGGEVIIPPAQLTTWCEMKATSNGATLVAGSSGSDSALWRVSAAGMLDRGFADDGAQTIPNSLENSGASLQELFESDGTIVAAGDLLDYSNDSSRLHMVRARQDGSIVDSTVDAVQWNIKSVTHTSRHRLFAVGSRQGNSDKTMIRSFWF